MKVRAVVVCLSVAAAALFAGASRAHDPAEFGRRIAAAPAAKPVPTTCAELSDAANFSNDLTHPDIKALQARCEAERKSAAGKTK